MRTAGGSIRIFADSLWRPNDAQSASAVEAEVVTPAPVEAGTGEGSHA